MKISEIYCKQYCIHVTELLPCVRQFSDQNKVFFHEHVSVLLDKWEALCILMQYEIELMYTFGIIAF